MSLLIHSINNANITYLDTKIKAFWDLNKTAILANNTIQFNEEDLKGKSFYQWKSMSYYYLLGLLILIQLDINHTGKEWSYYYEKYDLANIKKCLNCININLNKNIDLFFAPTNELIVEQIIEQSLGIEENLELVSLDGSVDLYA